MRGDKAWDDPFDEVDADVVGLMYEIGSRHSSTSERAVRPVWDEDLHPPSGVLSEAQARAAYRDRVARRTRGGAGG